jgi:hypothetical protein
MIVTSFKVTKRNKEVPTITRSPEMTEIVNSCKAEGKMLAESSSRSEDELTSTYQAIWSTREDYLEFIKNPIVIEFSERRAEINVLHGSSIEFQILNYED